MSGAFALAIDQGTSATKALRLDIDGTPVPLCALEHRQIYPRPGWVEHDAGELLDNVRRCVEAGAGAAALGLANQGETVVAWDARTGQPLCNAIVWQDSRTQPRVDALKAQGAQALTLARAGLPLDPYFSATKLAWILENVEAARDAALAGCLRLGTSDAFFLDRLCGVYATDATTASRTSLMNLASGQWDPELCALFGVPIELLPPIRPSVGVFGEVGGMPLTAALVDQQAALFGHGCRQPGDAKITFGTGAFALALTGERIVSAPDSGMLPTVAWRIGVATSYAVDGGVYNASSALDWARGLRLFDSYDELDAFEGPSALERGLVFVPALSGLACPYWDRSAAGLWLGMGLDTTRHDLVRALLEGVALRAAQALEAMHAQVPIGARVSVDGGLTRSRGFCAFLARALGREVVVPGSSDLTVLGCAQLALAGAGLCPLEALPPVAPARCRIEPEAPLHADYKARFADAVERARGWRRA